MKTLYRLIMLLALGLAAEQARAGYYANCRDLEIRTMAANNPAHSNIDGVIFNLEQDVLIRFPTNGTGSYVIPSSVTQIGPEAFLGCTELTNIVIPESVTNIGINAFTGCSGLSSLIVPNSVVSLGLLCVERVYRAYEPNLISEPDLH